METTGQFASVLLHAASSSCFLAFAETLTLMFMPFSLGESGGFSASATTSSWVSLILLCLQTSANIVAAQSAIAIIANSKAVGPVSSPPFGGGRSHTIVCALELSTTVRTFSIHLAVAFIIGISFHRESCSLGIEGFKNFLYFLNHLKSQLTFCVCMCN